MKRIFLIVLDSCGIGQMPDCEAFGDRGVNTLASCAATGKLQLPNMIAAGLGNIDGVSCLPKTDAPTGAYARLREASGYSEEIWGRKLMMVRALIFGMVFLYDAGEFEYNETTLEDLRYTINREFDIL